ncbi:MAG: GDSL-type esterase/lipase family protein [Nanoarchaeota archaeon]
MSRYKKRKKGVVFLAFGMTHVVVIVVLVMILLVAFIFFQFLAARNIANIRSNIQYTFTVDKDETSLVSLLAATYPDNRQIKYAEFLGSLAANPSTRSTPDFNSILSEMGMDEYLAISATQRVSQDLAGGSGQSHTVAINQIENVLVIGDSITYHGIDQHCQPIGSYTDGYVDYLNANSEINFNARGYIGYQTPSIQSCLNNNGQSCDTGSSELEPTFNIDDYDTVIILAGTNDVETSRTASDIIETLSEMFSEMKQLDKNVIAVTIPPRDGYSDKILEVNQWIMSAEDTDLRVNIYDDLESSETPGRIDETLTSDDTFVHPNCAGHNIMGQKILSAIEGTVSASGLSFQEYSKISFQDLSIFSDIGMEIALPGAIKGRTKYSIGFADVPSATYTSVARDFIIPSDEFGMASVGLETVGSGYCRPRGEEGSARQYHYGYDYYVAGNTPVIAVYSGKVVALVSDWGGKGSAVWIKTTLPNNVDFTVSYGHINIGSDITFGKEINQGEEIGTVFDYSTGSGSHLDAKIFWWPLVGGNEWFKQSFDMVDPKECFHDECTFIGAEPEPVDTPISNECVTSIVETSR